MREPLDLPPRLTDSIARAARLAPAVALLALGLLPARPALAGTSTSSPDVPAAAVSYDRDVRPILSDRCFKCHGFDPATRKAGLRLDTFDGATRPARGEPAVVPGDPDRSPLLARVVTHDEDERMPPSGEPLSAAQVDVLRRWIAAGAAYAQHWAYQPVRRVAPPAVRDRARLENPVDAFIQARLEQVGRSLAPRAAPAVLLRRVALDLTGLPPTVEDVLAFEANPTRQAYARHVRKLLASPAFGQHWARWWLDLARYGESTGYSGDFLHAMWPYRDWVIDALNRNLPFDQFTIEQVAGDLLPRPTRAQRIATGFYRAGPVTLDGGYREEEIQWMMARDRVNTTGTVWLAATLECAQCHTHKYDPFTIKEYYQLAAYFRSNAEEVISLGLRASVKRLYGATMVLDGYPSDAPGEEELQRKAADLAGRILTAKRISDEIVQGRRTPKPGEPDYVQLAKELNSKESDPLVGAYDRYAPYRLWVMQDRPLPRACHVLERGDWQRPGEAVTPGTPAALHPLRRLKVSNRLELARWLVSRDNPLTARVTVNRFWSELFGRGIVTSTEDFGRQGAQPSHPELLDWLATRFMDSGWDVKELLYLLVTSATYQQTSDQAPERAPDELFAFGPRHRLTAEALRDNLLAVAGVLDTRLHGPPVYPPQPDGLWGEIFQSHTTEYPTSTGTDIYRRSAYVIWRRGSVFPLFTTFDAPLRDFSTTRRSRSNTPLQALTLMNEPVFVDAARAFARLLHDRPGTLDERLTWAFRRAVARAPQPDELAVLRELFDRPGGDSVEMRAWFDVAHALLNLDETISKR